MNNVNQESKTSAIKTLAIIGFVAAVVLGLWIAVNLIWLIPTAFTSLASIADSLYGAGNGLIIKVDKDVVNSGEPLRVTWTPVREEGTYTFSYHCVNGISAEIRNSDGKIIDLACDTEVDIASGSLVHAEQTTGIIFKSEKQRFTDVAFTFAFYKPDTTNALYEKGGLVTVVNATIPQVNVAVTTPKPTEPVKTTPVVVTKPVTTTKPKPTYTTVPVQVTSFPVSNPNGYTDLQVTLVGVGTISNGVFIARSSVTQNAEAAMQFIVKNIGTKTSTDWNYALTLPSSNTSGYVSPAQAPLLPGERAIMTISFTAQDRTGTENAKVIISGGTDANKSNDFASKTVTIVR